MTTRKQSLTALRDAMIAGVKYETMGHTRMCQKAFPKPEDFDGSRESYSKSDAQRVILAWRNSDMTAALAFVEAELPGCPVQIVDVSPEYLGSRGWQASINWPHTEWREGFTAAGPFCHTAHAPTPALALTIAALNALIELEDVK